VISADPVISVAFLANGGLDPFWTSTRFGLRFGLRLPFALASIGGLAFLLAGDFQAFL